MLNGSSICTRSSAPLFGRQVKSESSFGALTIGVSRSTSCSRLRVSRNGLRCRVFGFPGEHAMDEWHVGEIRVTRILEMCDPLRTASEWFPDCTDEALEPHL